MDSPESQKPRLLAALTLAALTSAIGLTLLAPNGLLGDGLIHSSYDALHIFGGTKKLGDSPVVLIYLDLASHLQQRQDPSRPWPRELHARLLRRLSAAGARGAVFDVIFGTAGPDAQADEALGAAMRENGHVVFAAARSLGLPFDQAAAVAERGVLWVRYYGPALTLPHMSYSEALEAAAVPDRVFRDKIVFIGARPMEGLMNEGRDEFRSPFHSWS